MELTVCSTAQYLSKYGESAALLKDPSWTKDPAKADKGERSPDSLQHNLSFSCDY